MTKEVISQYCYLELEAQRMDELLREMERKTHNGTAAELEFTESQKQMLNSRKIKNLTLRQNIYNYIDNIDDCLVRMILFERYIKGKTWTAVAHTAGGGNTPDGVRKIASRFLEKFGND